MIKKALKKYNDIPLAGKATLWFVFCTMLQKCMALITTPIFTRLMSTTQYGQFTIYHSWLQIFTIFTTFRLNYAVFNKGMSKFKEDRDAYTSTMQTLTVILTTIVLLVYLLFRRQINALTELPTFVMLAIFAELYLTPAIDFWTLRKRYEYIYRPVVTRTVLMTVINAALGVLAVLLAEEKGYARIMSCVFVNICFGAVLFVYNLRKGKKLFVPEYAKFAILFNIPLLLHYLSQYVLDQFDRIMVQKMVSMAVAGVYGVAYSAGTMMRIVTSTINSSLVPWQYGKLEKGEFKELDDMLFLVYVGISGIAVAFIAFAPELMRILADRKFYEAVYVIPPVALGMVFSFMYTTFANTEFFFDSNKFTMYISMFGAGLNVILNYFGIQLFGYIAAAYTTLLCYILFAVSHFFYMNHSAKKKTGAACISSGTRLLVLGIITVSAGLGLTLLYDHFLIRYIILSCMLFVVWLKRDTVRKIYGRIRKKAG